MPTHEELYKKQLKDEQKKNPKVDLIVDTTEEDVNWLRGGNKKGE